MAATQPVLTLPHGGERVTTSAGSISELKIDGTATGGEYAVVEYTVRAGDEPPLHVHSREDEVVYVLEGELVARVGDQRIPVGEGACAALPRGVPHTIEVQGVQARLLLVFVPSGLERFFVPRPGEVSEPQAFGLTFV